MAPAGPVRAFLSYAHEDHAWRDRVLKQLGWLVNSGQLAVFDDRADRSRASTGTPDHPSRARPRPTIVIVLHLARISSAPRYLHASRSSAGARRQRNGTCRPDRRSSATTSISAARRSAAHQCLPQDETNDLKPLSDWDQTDGQPRPLSTDRRPLGASACGSSATQLAGRHRPRSSPRLPPAASGAATRPAPARPLRRPPDRPRPAPRAWILDDDRQPIIVLGPGGIGKSKLTIAALHDPAVAARFADALLRPARRRARRGRHPRRGRGGPRARARRATGRTCWRRCRGAGAPRARQCGDPLGGRPDRRRAAPSRAWPPARHRVWSPRLRGFELPGTADWRPMLVEPLPLDPARAPVPRHRRRRATPPIPRSRHCWPASTACRSRSSWSPTAPGPSPTPPPCCANGRRAQRLRPPRPGRAQGPRPRRLDRAVAGEPAPDRRRPAPVRRPRPPAPRPRPRRPARDHAPRRSHGGERPRPDRPRPARPGTAAHAGAGARARGRAHARRARGHRSGRPLLGARRHAALSRRKFLRPRRGAARTRRAAQHRGGPARRTADAEGFGGSAGAGSASGTRGRLSAASVWP